MSKHVAKFNNASALKQTEKALLVQLQDREDPIWVPQSVIHDDSEVYEEGGDGALVVHEWWAKEKGLI